MNQNKVTLNEFFNWHYAPFSCTNPVLSEWFSMREQKLRDLMISLLSQGSSFVVTGPPGIGKSVFMNSVLSLLDNNYYAPYYLTYSGFSTFGFIQSLADLMEIDVSGRTVPALIKVQKYINQLKNKNNRFPVVLIDDAQLLPTQSFYDLCSFLVDPITRTTLSSLIFVGDLALKQKLRLNVMSSINSRLGVIFELESLSKEETFEFISYRLTNSKAPHDLFEKSALELISATCKGNRREILKMCTALLMEAYIRKERLVSAELIHTCSLLKSG